VRADLQESAGAD